MALVLGTEIVPVTVFVSGLVIFFANATKLALDASIAKSTVKKLEKLRCLSCGDKALGSHGLAPECGSELIKYSLE
tara:strand:+ start:304 stop:531 length:228 start_codon:yes stop_codon:yes gene_type:complete